METKTFANIASNSLKTGLLLAACVAVTSTARGDETCSSPYLARIEGQEEFVYVWTLGTAGLGDGADKLVTVDVKPGSPQYGKVIHTHSVGGRHEAHHGGFTDDRRQLWLAGIETSRIFIYDVHSNPAQPKLVKTIEDFERKTGGAIGPHGVYALPGRVLIPCLSNGRITAAPPRWSNTATTATTSRRTGCPRRKTRAGRRARNLPMVTVTTRACCRAKRAAHHLVHGLE
jgi:selenium-binding protein 1